MSRKTLDDDEKNAVCVRYVQTGSLRAVAAEFGISAMRVKRLWDSIGSDQQQVIRASVEEVRQEVETVIVQSELTGDYLERVIQARNAAINELYNRLTNIVHRNKMTDKNLIAACKTLHDISIGAEQPQTEPGSLFMVLNQRIHKEINNNYGLNTFRPENIKYNRTLPKVMFTGFQLFNEEVEVGKEYGGRVLLRESLNKAREVKLDYKQNVFTVLFASDNYVLPP